MIIRREVSRRKLVAILLCIMLVGGWGLAYYMSHTMGNTPASAWVFLITLGLFIYIPLPAEDTHSHV